jgi:hypothetical protein
VPLSALMGQPHRPVPRLPYGYHLRRGGSAKSPFRHPEGELGLARRSGTRSDPELPNAGSLRLGGAKAIERGLKYRLEVVGRAVNGSDGNDHVENLFKRQIFSNFPAALSGEKEWSPSRHDALAALTHDGSTSP